MKNCYSLMEPKFKIPNLVLNNLSSPFLQFDKPKVAIFNEREVMAKMRWHTVSLK